MTRRHALVCAGLVAVCALVALWQRADSRVSRTPAVSASAAVPVVPPPSEGVPPPVASPLPTDDPAAEARIGVAERAALLRSDPDLADRARQDELAPAADARWEEAVAQGEYTANDLDVAVRELFRRVDLAPRYAEGGLIEGLLIASMPPDHPLAEAGFRDGDRIDSIQGVALRDPAELPSLLARLGPSFSLCAERDGAELCRELDLR